MTKIVIILLDIIIINIGYISIVDGRNFGDIYKQCVPIKEPECQDVHYSNTSMPNLVGSYSQIEASKRFRDFNPLINIKCSNYLKLFLCSVYFPMCETDSSMSTSSTVKPCRHLCNHVKERCEPLMKETFKLSWSEELDCDKFPERGKICLTPDSFSQDEFNPISTSQEDNYQDLYRKLQLVMQGNRVDQSKLEILRKMSTMMGGQCLPSEVNIGQMPNISCAQICSANVQFNAHDKVFANIWLLGWSVLCFFSCLLTIIVFSCNTNRFLYPEKPIVFLSICYFFYASGNLFGGILGRNVVACRTLDEKTDYVVGYGRETTWCKINFLMVYFFGSASALWWVVLTITWFLSASRHWGYEAIESISSMLHLLSWAIPALKSIFILILHKIDADELTGQCFVGNSNSKVLWGFVIVPNLIYLLTGIVFLTLGYISLLKVRRSFLQRPDCIDTNNLKRLEKLMAKIGVFSILYVLPVVCTVVSYVVDAYKMTNFDITVKALFRFSPNCISRNGINWSSSKCVDILQPVLPSVEMRMLRIFMNLVIGITSGIWIWGNKKTVRSCISTLRFWEKKKEQEPTTTNQCDSSTIQNNIPLSQMKQKETLLPYNDWKSNSSYPVVVEYGLPNVSVPSEIVPPPNNSSISDDSSRH